MSQGRQYITVMDWMWDDLGLTGNDILVYAMIYGFSQDGSSEFKGSANYVAQRLHIRKATALDILRRLTALGVIKKREFTYQGKRYCFYSAEPVSGVGTETVPGRYGNRTCVGTETVPNNKRDNKKDISPLTPQGETDGFDTFWTAYPKKVGKGAARKAWDRAVRAGAKLDEILLQLESLARSEQWLRESGRFVPNPATWLNQGRWEDPAAQDQAEREEVQDW